MHCVINLVSIDNYIGQDQWAIKFLAHLFPSITAMVETLKRWGKSVIEYREDAPQTISSTTYVNDFSHALSNPSQHVRQCPLRSAPCPSHTSCLDSSLSHQSLPNPSMDSTLQFVIFFPLGGDSPHTHSIRRPRMAQRRSHCRSYSRSSSSASGHVLRAG